MGTVNHQTPIHDHSTKQFGGKLSTSSIADLIEAINALVRMPESQTDPANINDVAALVRGPQVSEYDAAQAVMAGWAFGS